MKKVFAIIFAILTVATAFISCSMDVEDQNNQMVELSFIQSTKALDNITIDYATDCDWKITFGCEGKKFRIGDKIYTTTATFPLTSATSVFFEKSENWKVTLNGYKNEELLYSSGEVNLSVTNSVAIETGKGKVDGNKVTVYVKPYEKSTVKATVSFGEIKDGIGALSYFYSTGSDIWTTITDKESLSLDAGVYFFKVTDSCIPNRNEFTRSIVLKAGQKAVISGSFDRNAEKAMVTAHEKDSKVNVYEVVKGTKLGDISAFTQEGYDVTLYPDAKYTSGTELSTDTEITKDTDVYVKREQKLLIIKSHDATKVYDGTPLTNNGHESSGYLQAGDTISDVEITGSVTDATTATNTIKSYKIYRGTTDVTSEYKNVKRVEGVLEVTKREITLVSGSATKAYDGKALTNSAVATSGTDFPNGQGYTPTVTGSQTEVGSSANTFTYTLNAGTKASNYDITTVYGTLTVTEKISNYITFSSANPFTLTIPCSYNGTSFFKGIEYSTDTNASVWNEVKATGESKWMGGMATLSCTDLQSSADGKLYVRGKDNKIISSVSGQSIEWRISATSGVSVSGNIMSLLDYENPATIMTTESDFCFAGWFRNCTSLTDISGLTLPATTLARSCYLSMFYECTSITKAPALPAENLAEYCYYRMFGDCTSLEEAPELPADTLVEGCYKEMFSGCSGLKVEKVGQSETPTLGAKKIFTCPSSVPEYAVQNMFTNTGGSLQGGTPESGNTYYWYTE